MTSVRVSQGLSYNYRKHFFFTKTSSFPHQELPSRTRAVFQNGRRELVYHYGIPHAQHLSHLRINLARLYRVHYVYQRSLLWPADSGPKSLTAIAMWIQKVCSR